MLLVLAKQKYFANNGEAIAGITWSIFIYQFHVKWRGGEGCSMHVSCHRILSNLNVVWVTMLRISNNKVTARKHENIGQKAYTIRICHMKAAGKKIKNKNWGLHEHIVITNISKSLEWKSICNFGIERWWSPPPQLSISMYNPIANSCSSEHIFMSKRLSFGGVHRLCQHMGSVPLGQVTFQVLDFWCTLPLVSGQP